MNLRQQLVAKAIQLADATNRPRTIEGMAEFLPADFALEQIDLDEAGITSSPVEAEFHALEPAETAAVDDADFIEPPEPEPVKLPTPDEAQDAVIRANETLAQARIDYMVCQDREHAANGNLARAISQFQAGFDPYTPTQQAHDFARAEMEQRARVARGEIAPARHTVGRSRIDQARAWARGNGPDDGHGNPCAATINLAG